MDYSLLLGIHNLDKESKTLKNNKLEEYYEEKLKEQLNESQSQHSTYHDTNHFRSSIALQQNEQNKTYDMFDVLVILIR